MIGAAKEIIQTTLNSLGYRIERTNFRFAPWTEPEFITEVYDKISDRTWCSADRCYILDRLSRYCAHLEGDFAECGVWRGGTAFLIANVLQTYGEGKTLHLFDTFTGMPDIAFKERDHHQEGDFSDTSRQDVERYLSAFSQVVDIHEGFIPETFEGIENDKFAFVHVDVDIYPTSWKSCQFFYERLVKGAVMVFDDYAFSNYEDAIKRAVDEFFADKPEVVIALPTGQGITIKL